MGRQALVPAMTGQTLPPLPDDWRRALSAHTDVDAVLARPAAALAAVDAAYPPLPAVFRALALTPFAATRVVIVGQDPYHGPGQANGLAFSVDPGVRLPPSLRNIFKELASDLGGPLRTNGDLADWARQGVLLINSVLTVAPGRPASHRGIGWDGLTDGIIAALAAAPQPLVCLLWGAHAQAKARLLDDARHQVLRAPHPSPLSAHTGFFGSTPFSGANAALIRNGGRAIDWLTACDPGPRGA